MWNKERIVICGASGFIGSHLAERLVASGSEVLALGRDTERLRQLAGPCRVESCAIDCRDRLTALLKGFRPTVVYHMAAHPDCAECPDQVRHAINTNTLGALNLLEASIAAGAGVFVLADSVKAYGNPGEKATADRLPAPICSYAIAKTAAWQICKLMSAVSGLQVVALRLTFVYGPRQGWNLIRYIQRCVERNEPVQLQGGSQTRDPLFVDDAVNAFLAAARHKVAFGHAIPIGGGREITVREICEQALRVLGSSLPVIEDAHTPRLTEIWRSSSDNRDATRLMRWSPRVSLTDGLVRTLTSEHAVVVGAVARA